MVEDRVTDGRRIAQLLASEVRGREDGPLGPLSVADARDVDGSEDGEFAYGIDRRGATEGDTEGDSERDEEDEGAAPGGERLAAVYVHDDRTRLAFRRGTAAAAAAADSADLRTRRSSTRPTRTMVIVESGAAVKRAADVVADAAASSTTADDAGRG